MSKPNQLITGSIILLVLFNVFNLINFLFQFSMARFLSLADYGILASLFSITYFVGFFSESIQTVITKFTAHAHNQGMLRSLLRRSLRKTIFFSLTMYLIYLVVSIFLTQILHIPYGLLAINGLMIIFSIILPVGRGILNGKKKFIKLGLNVVIEASVKLILAISLVLIGFGVYGAIGATVLGAAFAFVLILLEFKDLWKIKEEYLPTPEIYAYTKPVFVLMVAILLFYSLDILIAKAIFSPDVAGAYAIASILGKIIFMGSQPISKAMFPLTADPSRSEKHSRNLFLQSLGLVILIIIISCVVIYLFPSLIIKIFSGKIIPQASAIILTLALAASTLAISNLIIFYKLSQGKTKYSFMLIFGVIIEVILLFLFSSSLSSFALAFLASSIIFLILSLFFPRDK